MKKLWPLLLLGIPLQAIHAQEVQHAPTFDQCFADQKLWLSEAQETYVPAPFTELYKRNAEMAECEKVDSSGLNRYYNTMGENNAEKVLRLRHFLERHNMYQEFLTEDAQGKR